MAEVHAQRVIDAFERLIVRELSDVAVRGFVLCFLSFWRSFLSFLLQALIDDVDPEFLECGENVLELVRRGHIGRQEIVDLVIRQEALGLAKLDQGAYADFGLLHAHIGSRWKSDRKIRETWATGLTNR